MRTRPTHTIGRLLRKAGTELMKRGGVRGTWIDVGAHSGESSLQPAIENPRLTIFAFEPNLARAARLIGRASNYFVVPAAIAEHDGSAKFYINAADVASSLLPLNESAAQTWIGGEVLRVESTLTVPTMRLDTFLNSVGIDSVDFLKIDAQGADLAVVRSAGTRLKDIRKIKIEVDITAKRLYEGSAGAEEVLAFMRAAGFVLSVTQVQSCGQEQDLTFVRAEGG